MIKMANKKKKNRQKKEVVVVRPVVKTKTKSHARARDSIADYRTMVLRPFDCVRSSRGAFAKCATDAFSLRQTVTLTTSAAGELTILVSPQGIDGTNGGFISYSTNANAANLAAADFTRLTASLGSSITSLYAEYRCLAGAAKLINMASWANTQGIITCGYVAPGALNNAVGQPYSAVRNGPIFKPVSPGDPVEVLWGSQMAYNSGSFPCTANNNVTVSSLLSTTSSVPYGLCVINMQGFAASTAVTLSVVFHLEALPLANVAAFLEPDISRLTQAEVDRVDMELAGTISRVRVGASALLDIPRAAGSVEEVKVAGGHVLRTNGHYTSEGAKGKHVPSAIRTVMDAADDLAVDAAVRLASKGVGLVKDAIMGNSEEWVSVRNLRP